MWIASTSAALLVLCSLASAPAAPVNEGTGSEGTAVQTQDHLRLLTARGVAKYEKPQSSRLKSFRIDGRTNSPGRVTISVLSAAGALIDTQSTAAGGNWSITYSVRDIEHWTKRQVGAYFRISQAGEMPVVVNLPALSN